MPRGNIGNLIKNSDLTPEERKEKAKKAGKKSGEVRHEKKTLRATMEAALQGKYQGELTAMQAGVQATIQRWIDTGDISMLNGIRDLIGEKPVEKISASICEENKAILKDYLEVVKK